MANLTVNAGSSNPTFLISSSLQDSRLQGRDVVALTDAENTAINRLMARCPEIASSVNHLLLQNKIYGDDIPKLKDTIIQINNQITNLETQKATLEEQEKNQEQNFTALGKASSLVRTMVPIVILAATRSKYGGIIITGANTVALVTELFNGYFLNRTQTMQENVQVDPVIKEEKTELEKIEKITQLSLQALQKSLDQMEFALEKTKEDVFTTWLPFMNKKKDCAERKEELAAGKSLIQAFIINQLIFNALFLNQLEDLEKLSELDRKISYLQELIEKNSASYTLKELSYPLTALKNRVVSFMPRIP